MIDILEFHVYNPITSSVSVMFVPSTISYVRELLVTCEQAYMYPDGDEQNGKCLKNRGIYPARDTPVSLCNFNTKKDVYTFLMDDNYPNDRKKYLRTLAPSMYRYGGEFARIEMDAVDPRIYNTYIRAFWKKLK